MTLFPSFFFFNDTATTEIYTLSLHDALPISPRGLPRARLRPARDEHDLAGRSRARSEEHTSELQSPYDLVCRLLLEKKKEAERCPTKNDVMDLKPSCRRIASISPMLGRSGHR